MKPFPVLHILYLLVIFMCLVPINTCLKVVMHQICEHCVVEHNFFILNSSEFNCELVL